MSLGIVQNLPGRIWAAFLAALDYANTNLSEATPRESISLSQGFILTCKNALDGINAYQMSQFAGTETADLSQYSDLSISVSDLSSEFIDNRITAMNAFALYMQDLVNNIVISTKYSDMLEGKSVINLLTDSGQSDIDLISKWMGFEFETKPSILYNTVDLISILQDFPESMQEILTAIDAQGVSQKWSLKSAIMRQMDASKVIMNEILNVDTQAFAIEIKSTDLDQIWNQMVAFPAIIKAINQISNNPSSLVSQQVNTIKYVIISTINQFNKILLSLRAKKPVRLNIATVNRNQTLMDIAASKMGDYSQWKTLATINNLSPPYISNAGGQNIAKPGDRIYITQPTDDTPYQNPIYEINYLGTDIYYGPLNQDMLVWTGDFNIVSGYQNFAISLGRRLQTTLGSLIYDSRYGSRIPPEIGKVQSGQSIGHILAYAKSALLSDPRTKSVQNEKIKLEAHGWINYSADVTPNGSGANYVSLNEVLQPY